MVKKTIIEIIIKILMLIIIIAITMIIIIIDMLLTCCKIGNGEIQSDMSEGNLRKRQNRWKRAIPMNHEPFPFPCITA